MTEIESKARQLAKIEGAPLGSYSICKQAIALEMAEWMQERIIEKARKFFEDEFISKDNLCVCSFTFDSPEELSKAFEKFIREE